MIDNPKTVVSVYPPVGVSTASLQYSFRIWVLLIKMECNSAVLFRNQASPFHRSLGGTHWATLRMDLLAFPIKRQILRLCESTAVLFRNLASPFHRSLGGTHWETLRMDLLGFPKKRQNSAKFIQGSQGGTQLVYGVFLYTRFRVQVKGTDWEILYFVTMLVNYPRW